MLLAVTTYVVPFTVPDNHIHVPVTIDGRTYDFLFDTGGAASIMPGIESTLHLPVVGEGQMFGGGSDFVPVKIVQAQTVTLGGAVLQKPRFTVLGGAIAASAKDFDGIIGREFFADYAIAIDYSAKTLTFTPVAQFVAPPGATAVPLSLRMAVMPNIRASVDGHEGSFDIDTGAAAGLTLTQAFAAQLPLHDARPVFLGIGAGGDVMGSVTRAGSLRIGGAEIDKPVTQIAAATGVFSNAGLAGNIGPDILKRFTLTLDFPAKTAYFVPHADVNAAQPFNRAGLFIKRSPQSTFVAATVWDGSPAASAGIQKGDEIVSVDGMDPSEVRKQQIFTRPAGTAVSIAFKHGAKVLTRRMILRDLL